MSTTIINNVTVRPVRLEEDLVCTIRAAVDQTGGVSDARAAEIVRQGKADGLSDEAISAAFHTAGHDLFQDANHVFHTARNTSSRPDDFRSQLAARCEAPRESALAVSLRRLVR